MDLGKLSDLSDHRVCKQCGAEFRTKKQGDELLTALMQFSDHVPVHQHTLGEWTEAYNTIQATKKKAS